MDVQIQEALRSRHSMHRDWAPFGEFIDAYHAVHEAVSEHGFVELSATSRTRLRNATLAARDDPASKASPLGIWYAKPWIGSVVGLHFVANDMVPSAQRPEFVKRWLLMLAAETPFLFEDAVIYPWEGGDAVTIRGAPPFILTQGVSLGQTQTLIDASGRRFCAQILKDVRNRALPRSGTCFPCLTGGCTVFH